MSIKYAGNVFKSKIREQLRKTGMIEPVDSVLTKNPALGEMYSKMMSGANYKEINREFNNAVRTTPGLKDIVADKVRKNVYDLSPEYVKQSLEIMSGCGELDKDEQIMVDRVLAKYAESKDVKDLREGTMELSELQLAKI